ncbi:MAG: hypothetical protein GX057_05170 [Clostridiales bacterium]|nr:hypothetical protein [Clostridiales bacterium]
MIVSGCDAVTVCSRDDLIAERGYDLLVFRADDTGRIISGFPHERLDSVGKCVYSGEFRGSERSEYVQRMLAGFSRTPFMITAETGCALVVRSMAPVANLCAAFIMKFLPDSLKALAQKGVFDMVVLPPGDCGRSRRRKNEQAKPHETALAERMYGYVREGFYGFCSDDIQHNAGKIVDRILAAVGGLAKIACCRCVCSVEEEVFYAWPFDLIRKFDGDIFAAFTLLSLLACGRAGLCRDAKLKIGILNGEPVIEIETETENRGSFPEIDECRRIADRRRLLYEFSIIKNRENDNSRIIIRYIPVRYDWSVLGIKSVVPFVYD